MKVTLFTIRVRMLAAGGVTGPESTKTADGGHLLELRRDPTGNIHLPGSTVAGSLRAHCCRDHRLTGLFGAAPSETKQPSSIQVLGTVPRTRIPEDGELPTHTRTAIDRERGTASTSTFRTVQQLPRGTEFDIMLRWDNPDQQQYLAFLEAVKTWQPRFGRGASHGSGHCALIGWGTAHYDLTSTEGLLAWIQHQDSYPGPDNPPSESAGATRVLDLPMEIVDGLHMGTPSPEPDDDGAKPNVVIRDDQGQPIIPGSSLKGVLRSRAEYICRVVGAAACRDQRCTRCRPCRLFGYSSDGGDAQRSRVAVPSARITEAHAEKRQHVAIDRFTGGAADTLLYRDEVITAGRFHLVVEELVELDATDRILLRAVATDLHDGLVGLGSSTTRGLGTVRITDSDWTRADLTRLATLLTDGKHP